MSEEKSTLITQSNQLVGASYQITLAEKRIILFMLSQIKKDDEDFKPYRMNIKDFMKEVGTNAKNEYRRAQLITKQLISRVLELPIDDKLVQVSFLSSAQYVEGKGYVELCFDPLLKPFLLQLKECFTTYDIRNVLSLKSFHSIRLYELLKQYETIGHRLIEVAELKRILGLKGQYSSYNLFKKRVILRAQDDLYSNADITFEFEEIKTGRKVESIRFVIKKNRKIKPQQITQTTTEVPSEERPSVFYKLQDLGIDSQQALSYLEKKDEKQLEEAIDYAKKQYSINKVHTSLAGYLKACIDKDVATETPYEKKQREEIEAKQRKQEEDNRLISEWKKEFDEDNDVQTEEFYKYSVDEDRQRFYETLSDGQKKLFFDVDGKPKKMLEQMLKGFIARENGVDRTDEAFQLWVEKVKGVHIVLSQSNGRDSWSIESQQAKLF